MTDAKFEILKSIYPATSSQFPANLLIYFMANDENLNQLQQDIDDLRQMGFIKCSEYNAWLTPAGIKAMEDEEQARTQHAFEAKQAKLDRRPQWVAVGLSLCALIISIIALWRAW